MENNNLTIEKMPVSIDEFIDLRNKIATTPHGGAAIFVIALKMYAENPQIGIQALVISVDRKKLTSGSSYKGFDIDRFAMSRIKEQVKQYPYIADSYFSGSNPENGYKAIFPAQMDISANPHSGDINSGHYKVFVRSSGADSARPISLQRNDKGLWKATEWSTIIMGIRNPIQEISDDL